MTHAATGRVLTWIALLLTLSVGSAADPSHGVEEHSRSLKDEKSERKAAPCKLWPSGKSHAWLDGDHHHLNVIYDLNADTLVQKNAKYLTFSFSRPTTLEQVIGGTLKKPKGKVISPHTPLSDATIELLEKDMLITGGKLELQGKVIKGADDGDGKQKPPSVEIACFTEDEYLLAIAPHPPPPPPSPRPGHPPRPSPPPSPSPPHPSPSPPAPPSPPRPSPPAKPKPPPAPPPYFPDASGDGPHTLVTSPTVTQDTPKPSATAPKPAGAEPKPAGTEPEPAGAGPKPAGAGPKPAGAGPKPAGAGHGAKPAGAGPKPAGAGPKNKAGAGPKAVRSGPKAAVASTKQDAEKFPPLVPPDPADSAANPVGALLVFIFLPGVLLLGGAWLCRKSPQTDVANEMDLSDASEGGDGDDEGDHGEEDWGDDEEHPQARSGKSSRSRKKKNKRESQELQQAIMKEESEAPEQQDGTYAI